MTRIFAALFLIAVFACGVILALLPREPQFTMTPVDDYWLYRDIIPAQVRAGSEAQE